MASPTQDGGVKWAARRWRRILPHSSSTSALIAAGTVALLLLAATAALMHAMTARFASALNRTQEQEQKAESLASLSASLRDAERAQMIYLLTGSEDASKRFTEECARVADGFEALRGTSAAGSEMRSRLDGLEPDLGNLISRMSRLMQQRRTYGPSATTSIESIAVRDSVDEIVRTFWSVQQQVTASNRSQMTLDLAATFRKELLAFGIALLAFIGSAFWILALRRQRIHSEQRNQEIAQRADLWRGILDSTPIPIAVLSEHRRLVACNPAFERFSLYSEKDYAGLVLDDCMVPKSLKLEAAEHMQHASTGVSRSLLTRRVRRDGTSVETLIKSVPLFAAGKCGGAISLFLEPTEQKLRQAEISARQAIEQRDAAIEERDRLAADLLASICGPLLELRASTRSLSQIEDSAESSQLGRVCRAVDSLSAIVQQLADLRQAEQGKLQLTQTDFNLREVLDASFPTAIDSDVPERIVGDPHRLREVVETLGRVHARGANRPALCVELESRNNHHVCLHFSFAGDGGSDLAPTSVARRLSTKLLALMGGRLWGDSQSRGGLQFHAVFALPASSLRLRREDAAAVTSDVVN